MLCPKCGKEVGQKVKVCSECKPKGADNTESVDKDISQTDDSQIKEKEFSDTENTFSDVPAGFWLRFFAVLGDSIIINILNLIFIELIIASVFSFKFENIILNIVDIVSSRLTDTQVFVALIVTALATLLVTLIIYALLFLIFSLFYNSLFESSKWQATPGKKLIGIYVTNAELKRQNLIQALKRNVFKIISLIPFGFGYMLAGLTEEKQALHDCLSKSYVFKDVTFDKTKRTYTCLGIVAIFLLWSFSQSTIKYSTNEGKLDFNSYKSKKSIIGKSSIPDDSFIEAKGFIGTERFDPNSAYISEQGILTFREGREFFADKKISIFLFNKIEKLANKTIKINSKEFGNPHVHISWKVPDKKLPKTVILTSNYLLDLKFASIKGRKIKGRINLKAGGEKETSFKGEFEATIR